MHRERPKTANVDRKNCPRPLTQLQRAAQRVNTGPKSDPRPLRVAQDHPQRPQERPKSACRGLKSGPKLHTPSPRTAQNHTDARERHIRASIDNVTQNSQTKHAARRLQYVLLCFSIFLSCFCFSVFGYILLLFAMFCYVFAMLLLCFAMFCYVSTYRLGAGDVVPPSTMRCYSPPSIHARVQHPPSQETQLVTGKTQQNIETKTQQKHGKAQQNIAKAQQIIAKHSEI